MDVQGLDFGGRCVEAGKTVMHLLLFLFYEACLKQNAFVDPLLEVEGKG